MELNPRIVAEAKVLVAVAFRNGPIEDVHAGSICTACYGKPGYSHITQSEMRDIVRNAVNWTYRFLLLRETDPNAFDRMVQHGLLYTAQWDEPEAVHE